MSIVLLAYNVVIETLICSIREWLFTDLKYIDSVISTSCSDERRLISILSFLPWNWINTSCMTIINNTFVHEICSIDLPYWPLFILWTGADIVAGWIKIKLPNSRKMTFHRKWAEPIINGLVKLPTFYCVVITRWE